MNTTMTVTADVETINLDININQGENWAFVGNNASGKSILGTILLNKMPKCGLVSFEKIESILEEERLKDDTDFMDRIDHGTLVKDYLKGSPHYFNVDKLLNRGLKYLSTGELTKVVILKELENDIDTLILDEPYDSMDKESQELISELISQLCKKPITLILIVNRDGDIHPEIDKVALIDSFKLILKGNRNDVLTNESYKLLRHYQKALPKKLPGQMKVTHPNEVLISIKNLDICFGDTKVLKDINWSVNHGEHFKISGPNGSGKSTLLKVISADSNQSYGKDITLFGIKRGSGESIWDIKKHVGLVSSSLQKDYRVSVNLLSVIVSGFYDSIGIYNSPSNTELELAYKWLEIGGLKEKANSTFKSLSYGEQRVGLILRALVKHPQVLILDEPCLGLDDINKEMILKLIENIAQIGNTTILYVSHRSDDIIPSIKKELKLKPTSGGSLGEIIDYP